MKRTPLRRRTGLKARKGLKRTTALQPGKSRLKTKKRRAWPEPVRRAILERDGCRCRGCGRQVPENTSPHHIRFRSQGGKDVATNGVTLCWWGCHEPIHGLEAEKARQERRRWERWAEDRWGPDYWKGGDRNDDLP